MPFTEELAANYLNANYWVILSNGVLSFKPGRQDHSLTKLHARHNVKTSALISASNPLSILVSNKQNRKASLLLSKDIKDWFYYNAEGTKTGSSDKAEKSFLILGIPRKQALQLGRKYKQHAIVFCHTRVEQTTPRLLACHPTNQIILDRAFRRFQRLKKLRKKLLKSFLGH